MVVLSATSASLSWVLSATVFLEGNNLPRSVLSPSGRAVIYHLILYFKAELSVVWFGPRASLWTGFMGATFLQFTEHRNLIFVHLQTYKNWTNLDRPW